MNEAEYTQRRKVRELIEWVDRRLACMPSDIEDDDAYRNRGKNKLWKKFAEEARPLSRFLAKYPKIPPDAVVTLTTDTGLPYDAKVEWKNNCRHIEITTTVSPSDAFSRAQQNTNDFFPGETSSVRTDQELSRRRKVEFPEDFGQPMHSCFLAQEELGRIAAGVRKKLRKKLFSGDNSRGRF